MFKIVVKCCLSHDTQGLDLFYRQIKAAFVLPTNRNIFFIKGNNSFLCGDEVNFIVLEHDVMRKSSQREQLSVLLKANGKAFHNRGSIP